MSDSALQPTNDDLSRASAADASLVTDLLILPDGTVLAHNLTSPMAAVLHELNPKDESMLQRARPADSLNTPVVAYELPN